MLSGRAARRPAMAPAWAVQSPPRTRSRGAVVRAASPARPTDATRSRSRGRNSQIAARFLARGSASGRKPGSIRRSPASRNVRVRRGPDAPEAGRPARARAARPASAPSRTGDRRGRWGRRRSTIGWFGSSSGGMVTHHWADAHRRLRARALSSPGGSSTPATCSARRTSRATRWPSSSRSPTTRRARCGTA